VLDSSEMHGDNRGWEQKLARPTGPQPEAQSAEAGLGFSRIGQRAPPHQLEGLRRAVIKLHAIRGRANGFPVFFVTASYAETYRFTVFVCHTVD